MIKMDMFDLNKVLNYCYGLKDWKERAILSEYLSLIDEVNLDDWYWNTYNITVTTHRNKYQAMKYLKNNYDKSIIENEEYKVYELDSGAVLKIMD